MSVPLPRDDSPIAARGAGQLSKQAEKGIRSLEKQIWKHQEKLGEFKRNPTVRPGMEDLPRDAIERQQLERIKHLEGEIQTFRDNIEKIEARRVLAMSEKRLIAAPAGRLSQVIDDLRRPFATILWVESLPKEKPETVIDQMIAAGCEYFVCAGGNSELTHDLIDDRIVALGASDVTTTFHEDESEEEVVDFFLSCAADGMSSLLALVEPGSEQERAIREAFAASSG